MASEFFMTLPSNTNTKFEGNTIANFTVRLPQKVVLDGDWEVALVEIMYPHTWHNVTGRDLPSYGEHLHANYPNSFWVWSKNYFAEMHCLTPPSYYGTIDDLLNGMEIGLQLEGKYQKEVFIRDSPRTEKFYTTEISRLEEELKDTQKQGQQKISYYQNKLEKSRSKRSVDAALSPIGGIDALVKGHELTEQKKVDAYLEKVALHKQWEEDIENLSMEYSMKETELEEKVQEAKESLVDWRQKMELASTQTKVPDIDGLQFRHDKTLQRVSIDMDTEKISRVVLSPRLAYMLGYNDGPENYIMKDKQNLAKYPVDLTGGFYALYIYCTIVENQIVGNYRVPLLRTVHVKGKHGDICEKIFHSPHYVPVVAKEFDTLEIDIKADIGQQSVDFKSGKVVVKLHFRKKRMFY